MKQPHWHIASLVTLARNKTFVLLGFPVPMRHWLAGDELYGWAQDTINESQTEDIFNKKEVLEMLKEHRDGVSDHSRRLWTVLSFMIWHGIFVEKRIDPQIEQRDYPVKL